MRPIIPLAFAVIALAACQPQDPDGAAAQAPADAPPAAAAVAPAATPADFAGDIDARGTEPFWALTIRANQLTLSRPDQPNLIVGNSKGAAMEGATAVFGYAPLVAKVTKAPCSDGMSDLAYPLTVEVTAQGATLKGCGAKTSEMPKGEGGN